MDVVKRCWRFFQPAEEQNNELHAQHQAMWVSPPAALQHVADLVKMYFVYQARVACNSFSWSLACNALYGRASLTQNANAMFH